MDEAHAWAFAAGRIEGGVGGDLERAQGRFKVVEILRDAAHRGTTGDVDFLLLWLCFFSFDVDEVRSEGSNCL